MRIMVATYYYLPHVGGGTWYLYHICRGLAELGHEVILYAPLVRLRLTVASAEQDLEDGVEVIRLNRRPVPRWLGSMTALNMMRSRPIRHAREAAVLMGQFNPHHLVAFATVLLGKLVRRPVVLRIEDWRRWMFGLSPGYQTWAEWILAWPMNTVNEWAAKHANKLLVVDDEAAAYFLNQGCSPRSILVSPNGVDLASIRNLPMRDVLRSRLGLPESAPIVVLVGRFSGGEYGVDVLLEAFEAVNRKRPDALLVLVGDELSPQLRAEHRELIEQGIVRITGPVAQADAIQYTAAADVAIGPLLPTRTTPLKVVEAFASQTFVVLGRGSIDARLARMSNRFTAVAPEPEALAATVLSTLEQKRHVATAGSLSELEDYGWEGVVGNVNQELMKLAGEPTVRLVAE